MPSVGGADLDARQRQALAESFVGVRAGAAEIVSAEAQTRFDGEDPYLLLSLSLGPPPATGTWTTDDMFDLSQLVRQKLRESRVEGVTPSFVGGASPEELDDDDVSADKDAQPVPDAGR